MYPSAAHVCVCVQGDKAIVLTRAENSRLANCQHGLARTLVSNMVVGVDTGFTTTLNVSPRPGPGQSGQPVQGQPARQYSVVVVQE